MKPTPHTRSDPPDSGGGVLRVGVDEAPAPPLCFGLPGTPEFRGFEVDLLASIAGRLGLRLSCESVEWGTALDRLLSGGLDMLCRAVTITPERGHLVSFSDPYFETALVLVLRRHSQTRGIGDLIGLKVGVRRATVAESVVRSSCPTAAVITFDDHAASYQALGNGVVDAVVDHETIATHFVRSAEEWHMTDALEGARLSYGMVFAPDNEHLRQTVNRVLTQLRSDGTWEHHREYWRIR